eukprot:TRINITY_DN23828_c0_g1_i1.p1 TRINITY_DN23828_c0_g1~~TRINITY_DN23828_c0_g1_i1.p1  ORF type:complete len:440 (+),score=72.97 TRINITY_DN23828_c0_g1_i1:82-1320(+)
MALRIAWATLVVLCLLQNSADAFDSIRQQNGQLQQKQVKSETQMMRRTQARREPLQKAAVALGAQGSVSKARPHGRLHVAFAVFVTDIVSRPWSDALRVLAHGIRKAANVSRHDVHLLALSPEQLSAEVEQQLLSFGFERVLRKPVPVQPADVKRPMAREHMERVQGQHGGKGYAFKQADETVKYWGLGLVEYDRVLVLDADTMVLDPMDELMERSEDFVGVRDHGLDVDMSVMPPTQGGFLLFRPNARDFAELQSLTREGDWGGNGWKNSGIGYCYGGVGPDGLLTYYYNKDALPLLGGDKASIPEGLSKPSLAGSRMLAADRAVYDVVINNRLMSELAAADHRETLSAVKSAHFTGDCIKPWTCQEPRGWLCEGLFERWWAARADVEKSLNLPATPRSCQHGEYVPLASS